MTIVYWLDRSATLIMPAINHYRFGNPRLGEIGVNFCGDDDIFFIPRDQRSQRMGVRGGVSLKPNRGIMLRKDRNGDHFSAGRNG